MSEELIVRHCSPTLAGIKTGSLFSCSYESSDMLKKQIRSLNRRLSSKGLRILLLKIRGPKALIYVYRPEYLRRDLTAIEAAPLLHHHGYSSELPGRCVCRLIDRLHDSEEFPHEIGLFLGYPPEDVLGFIDNNAKYCKYVGCWKVYGDEKKAKRLFASYKRCTTQYLAKLEHGENIDNLTVAI